MGVDADIAMRDQRQLRLMHEFHWIFHRDDVARRGAVAVIDHGGERCRFAAAGGADHEHHAALGHHHVLESLGQPVLFDGRHIGGNGSDDHADVLLLYEHVDAVTRHLGYVDGEIAFEIPGKLLALLVVHDRVR